MLTLDMVKDAAQVLREATRQTGLVYAPNLSGKCKVYLKPECMQVTGSFKVRGAYYKISTLSAEEKSRGVIACSAGNHAQGVALAAQRNGIKALICLPEGAPISKVQATRSYGAEICMVPGVYDDAYARAIQLRDEKGYTFIHPFDDEAVMAGQGTLALEMLQENPDLDAIVVPIGGGGLISGIAFTAKQLKPSIKVFGVQATGAPSMYNAIREGRPQRLERVSTIADGIAVKESGANTFPIVSQYVDQIVTVNDDEIATAILTLIEKQKIIAEGAGAVPMAAIMFDKLPLGGKNVCCLVSGGNIDVNILSRVIQRGQLMTGRNMQFTAELQDKPGQLELVSHIIASHGGNVIMCSHERSNAGTDVVGCYLRVEVETRDEEHIRTIRQALIDAGIKLV